MAQENASIGRKIGLTERIVSVLPEMKCPSNLEPHQVSIIFTAFLQILKEIILKTNLAYKTPKVHEV